MRVLITGATGFVGKHLSSFLKDKGCQIWGMKFPGERAEASPDLTCLDADIVNPSDVASVMCEVKPDWVIHLAAQSSVALSWQDPKGTFDVNLGGTVNLMQQVEEFKPEARFLLIGSSEEYGSINSEKPISEETSLKAQNPYAVSKVAQELMALGLAKAYNIDMVAVRPFPHIGPGQSPTFVCADFAKQIAEIEKGLNEPVINVGNLSAVRDFTDVRDIVRAYWLLFHKGQRGEVYNVCSGIGRSIQEIMDALLALTDRSIKVEVDPRKLRPLDVPIFIGSNAKIGQATSWQPVIDLKKTLKDTLDYWRQYK